MKFIQSQSNCYKKILNRMKPKIKGEILWIIV